MLYLDYPVSGNRTYRDAMADRDSTLIFNAFEGNTNILRVFWKEEPIDKDDARFEGYLSHFGVDCSYIGSCVLDVDAVETSCQMAIPYMKYEKQRNSLKKWAKILVEDGSLEIYMDKHKEPPSLKDISWYSTWSFGVKIVVIPALKSYKFTAFHKSHWKIEPFT